jgi:carboxylesterase
MFIIFLLISSVILLLFSYWGIPFKLNRLKDYTEPDTGLISEKSRPVELIQQSNTGILLIHGFEGSPFELKELGDYLYSLGYSVSIPLLPGHGTTIDNLIKTDFNNWYFQVEKSYFKIKQNCRQIYIIGLSLGGLLAIKMAENHKVDALITISAPVFFNRFYNGKWIMTDYRLFFSGILSLFIKKIHIARKNAEGICPWDGYADYLALNCVHSIKRNISRVRRNLYKVSAPICIIHAKNDFTVPVENAYHIFEQVNSAEKREFSFYIPNDLSTNHVLTTLSFTKNRVFTYILQFIKDCEIDFNLEPRKLLYTKNYLRFLLSRFSRSFKKWL